MIYRFAEKIVHLLSDGGAVNSENKDLLSYGLFVIINYLLYLLFTVIYGAVRHSLISCLIFYFSFCFIRAFAGGYHASSERKCFIVTVISIVFSCEAIVFFQKNHFLVPVILTAFFALATICVFSPIDNEQKRLNEKEKKRFKFISVITAFVYFTCVAILYSKGVSESVSVCISLMLEATLIIVEKIKLFNKNQREGYNIGAYSAPKKH